MKATTVYSPIVITLETAKEFEALYDLLEDNPNDFTNKLIDELCAIHNYEEEQ